MTFDLESPPLTSARDAADASTSPEDVELSRELRDLCDCVCKPAYDYYIRSLEGVLECVEIHFRSGEGDVRVAPFVMAGHYAEYCQNVAHVLSDQMARLMVECRSSYTARSSAAPVDMLPVSAIAEKLRELCFGVVSRAASEIANTGDPASTSVRESAVQGGAVGGLLGGVVSGRSFSPYHALLGAVLASERAASEESKRQLAAFERLLHELPGMMARMAESLTDIIILASGIAVPSSYRVAVLAYARAEGWKKGEEGVAILTRVFEIADQAARRSQPPKFMEYTVIVLIALVVFIFGFLR